MNKYKNETMERAASIIKTEMKAESVFCFGEATNHQTSCSFFSSRQKRYFNSIHYDFLVITRDKRNIKPGTRMKIKDRMCLEELSCTMVVHTLEEVKRALKNNNRFFHQVIHTVDQEDEVNDSWAKLLSIPFNRKANEAYTWQCHKTFSEQIEIQDRILYSSQDLRVCIPMISGQLERICLLLIHAMMGYEPTNYNLKGLINLCGCIDRRFKKIIPRITESDYYHYDILTQGAWKGTYGQDREPITTYLYKAIDDFKSLAEQICQVRLNLLTDSFSTPDIHFKHCSKKNN